MGSTDLPILNRPETTLGIVITFLVLAWVAISLRLYVRLKIGRWGWDDALLFVAGISTTAGASLTCLMPGYGMGRHYWTLSPLEKMEYFKHIWSTNVTYCASTTFIKLAILVQYLRLFDMQNKTARILTWAMIGVTALWGTIFFLLALFACQPVAKNWIFDLPGTCVAWGSKDSDTLFTTYATHSALNMALDFFILILPIPFLKKLRIQGKTRLGLIALFTMGGIVTLISAIRMVSLCIKRAGTVPVFDPSWASPAIYICSVLEVKIAIMCASVPVFWPFVSSLAMNKILVVNEIEIRTDRRESQNFGGGLAEQGAGLGRDSHPDFDSKGRTSRVSILPNGSGNDTRIARSTSRHQRSKSSTSTAKKGGDIELGTRVSQDSQQSLAHQASLSAISFSSLSPPELTNPLNAASHEGTAQYSDRYAQAWACPDFDAKDGDRSRGNTYTTTVERAEIPFDHIKALER